MARRSGRAACGPGLLPAPGADLATGKIECGGLICPWHGLRLEGGREFGWKPLPAHDDGVLVWVRLDKVGGEEPLDAPVLPKRPAGDRLAAVTRLEGSASRATSSPTGSTPGMGPGSIRTRSRSWRSSGAPVDADDDSDVFLVAVTFHLGRVGVPVIAEFTVRSRGPSSCTSSTERCGQRRGDPRHPDRARPRRPARTAVIEAVIAQSDRPGSSIRCGPRR